MIHQKIRSLRELKKLRHEDMADRLGISQSAYSRMETGEAKLDVKRLKKIAEVLEVPAEELLNTEPIVFNVQNNSGGSYGWYNQHLEQHEVPKEFLQQLLDRYDTHANELRHITEQVAQMNQRLLDLLERKLG